MKEVCEIGFIRNKDLLIIPHSSILFLIEQIRTAENNNLVVVESEDILPPDLVTYITRVINSNRGLQKFKFHYIKSKYIGEYDVLYILSRQLVMMTANNKKCFKDVTHCKTKMMLTLEVNPEVKEMLDDKKRIVIIE